MTYDPDALIRVAHVGMHPDRLRKLVRKTGTPTRVLRRIESGELSVPASAREAAAVPADERREQLRQAGIEFLVPGDSSFPGRLAELDDAPLFLFQKGGRFEGTAVAIVGTRACTTYGRRLAERYGEAVSRAGWWVASGLAKGIDGAAHAGSLRGPTPGIAVLGSGVDVWYPRLHRDLGMSLLEAGGVVWSEAPPGARPLGWRFPPRNRIISGIAQAVVVVEAGAKGGALVTSRLALEQGRDIFATPGDVGRPSSVGCNLLIRDGAFPVLDAEDLVESLELAIGPAPGATPSEASAAVADPGIPVADFLATLGDDPVLGMAELGRLMAQGAVTIDGDGMVVTAPGGIRGPGPAGPAG
ncbi:MAG: DNA-protecting protein DprA [Acidimicrobiia bacterium]|nr:DNA-protecting protein DprA [Acidimicrobiia bacterium]